MKNMKKHKGNWPSTVFEQKDMPISQMIPVTGSLNKKEEEKGF